MPSAAAATRLCLRYATIATTRNARLDTVLIGWAAKPSPISSQSNGVTICTAFDERNHRGPDWTVQRAHGLGQSTTDWSGIFVLIAYSKDPTAALGAPMWTAANRAASSEMGLAR